MEPLRVGARVGDEMSDVAQHLEAVAVLALGGRDIQEPRQSFVEGDLRKLSVCACGGEGGVGRLPQPAG